MFMRASPLLLRLMSGLQSRLGLCFQERVAFLAHEPHPVRVRVRVRVRVSVSVRVRVRVRVRVTFLAHEPHPVRVRVRVRVSVSVRVRVRVRVRVTFPAHEAHRQFTCFTIDTLHALNTQAIHHIWSEPERHSLRRAQSLALFKQHIEIYVACVTSLGAE